MEASGKRTSFLGQSEEKPGEGPDTLSSLQKTSKLLKKKLLTEREEKQTLQNLLKTAEEQQTALQGVLAERVGITLGAAGRDREKSHQTTRDTGERTTGRESRF